MSNMAPDATLGRDSELAAVFRFIDNAFVGKAATLIQGEAGVGKTTIWREGMERAPQQITLQGQFDQQATENNVLAVTGGAGAYSEVRGQAILRFTHRYRFDIDLEN